MSKEESKIIFEVWNYKNVEIVEIKPEISALKWVSVEEDPIYQGLLKNKGIGMMHSLYIETSESQNKAEEYKKIISFLRKYMEHYARNNNMAIDDVKTEFINYGKTELVYVLTDKNGQRLTLLVKQPIVTFGNIYKEMQYLLELNEKDKNVVAPIDYFQFEDYELYVTPYINQARCIASYAAWGMYIPEPYYRFEPFSIEQEKVVNTCMIAKLVSLYDFKKQEGISCCKLGGGDFMLSKGWENEIPTIENTLSQLYLIAAREKVNCSFEESLQLIKDEFSRRTISEVQSQIIINLRGRVPMKVSDIDNGIELGKTIIANQGKKQLIKK